MAKYPIRSLAPTSSPYLALAYGYARSLEPARARQLVVQYVSTVDPLVRLDAESFHHLVMGEIALAERQQAVAVAEFRQSQGCPICGVAGLARAYDASGMVDSAIAVYERYLTTPKSGG